ncbi:MAG: LytTR family DNA-binding domain-containing protein [Saprospiraceae bacterium]|nr:LytTR family DNA-binding domain-containing protein [Saprospiraceae bacterium]
MLKAVIIDDEAQSRMLLNQMLEAYCPEVNVVGMAKDVLSGIKIIQNHHPQIVFLDIEMPNYSGFQLIHFFEGNLDFEIIFVTAYHQYAIQAFKASAIGYLLKPIDIDELISAVKKTSKLLQSPTQHARLETVRQNIDGDQINRVVFPGANSFIFLNTTEISYLESDGRNTMIHLMDHSEPLRSTASLKDCEDLLKNNTFIRIHRSFVINLIHIQKFSRGRDSFVQMDNGTKIDVGRSYKETLSEAIDLFTR